MTASFHPALPDMPSPPAVRGWNRLRAPLGYQDQWRRLMEAALELDLGPDDLVHTGLDPLAAARDWKPATVALYTKVARYGGLQMAQPRTPEPDPVTLDLRELTRVRGEAPEHLRTVAWCAIALGWPGTVGQFRSLRRDQVLATTRRLLVSTEDGDWAVPGALTAWHAWEEVRNRFPALETSPWVLPALRRGPGPTSHVGGRLSTQALQVTFTKHAVRTALQLQASAAPSQTATAESLATHYARLSYDSYRRLVLSSGVEPVAPRGAVRAERAVRRAARQAD